MSSDKVNWSTVVGHEWAVEHLAGARARGRLAHAYLLVGPAQVGKTTLARTFAQAVNCLEEGSNPCMSCRACKLIANDGHPDVRMIKPLASTSGRTESIRIGQVRELQRELALAPYEGHRRVAILTRFETASTGAANALLKTLEEPQPHVILVLTATTVDALLPTIVSRCQVLTLRALPPEKVEAALLMRWGASERQAYQLAHISGGRLGLAVHYMASPGALEEREKQLEWLALSLQGDRTARFKLADRLTRRKGPALDQVLETWQSWWRDVMLVAGRPASTVPVTNIDRQEGIRAAAERYGLEGAAAAVGAIRETLWQLESNANARLALEVLMLTLPR